MRVFGCFLLFHMLFDFYFQSNKMAGEKEYSRIALAMHCLIYAAGAAATVALLFEASAAAMVASFTVFALSHWFRHCAFAGALAVSLLSRSSNLTETLVQCSRRAHQLRILASGLEYLKD